MNELMDDKVALTGKLTIAVTALTVVERANLALSTLKDETQLKELAAQSAGIAAITNAAGYAECNRARIVLKNERISIDRLCKDARDDANKFGKAIISEQERRIGFILPEELRLAILQDAWDKKIEEEKAAKKKAEDDRCSSIRARIAVIVNISIGCAGHCSDHIRSVIEYAESINVSAEQFHEFADQAASAKQEALSLLESHLKDRILFEVEQSRIVAERAELQRIRAELAEKEAANQRKLKADNDRIAAELKAEQDKIAAERKEQASLLKIEKDKIAADRKYNDSILKIEMDKAALEWAKINAEKIEAQRLNEEKEEAEQNAKIAALIEEKRINKMNADKAAAEAKVKEEADRIASEKPEMQRLKDWLIVADETLPEMNTISGKAYEIMLRNVLDKALHEINERHV